mgnify:CR=1 FL=1
MPMNNTIFNFIITLIPVISIIITGFFIPYIKAKMTGQQLETINQWITYAVNAAEVLFQEAGSGTAKREYVISFIDNMFNRNKEIITREQIRILLEAAWKEMIGSGGRHGNSE